MFLQEVFKKNPIDALDKETLFTIHKFFENNLNVSETARKLFVHRKAFLSILVAACTSDMALRILPEYPVPIPAGRQGVSPANVLGGGAPARKRWGGTGVPGCSRRKLPAGLLTTIAVTVSFQLTVLIQAHPHPKAGES